MHRSRLSRDATLDKDHSSTSQISSVHVIPEVSVHVIPVVSVDVGGTHVVLRYHRSLLRSADRPDLRRVPRLTRSSDALRDGK